MAGQLQPSENLYLRVACGTAQSEVHGKFELDALPGGSPIIRSLRTGRYWTIDWNELLAMAIAAGITEPEAPDAP